MDLSKLTPAPWWMVSHNNCLRAMSALRDGVSGPFGNPVDGEFTVLARAAFDVMMRRGWHAQKRALGWVLDVFSVRDELSTEAIWRLNTTVFSDPFTALVEADKWYRENVESKLADNR